MDRKKYWNEDYMAYWQGKVAAANDSSIGDVTAGDSKTTNDGEIYHFFDKITYKPNGKVLDFGCGFGRFYDYFREKGQRYYGIDISNAMIQEFLKRYPQVSGRVAVAEGESLPFSDDFFDAIVCNGVFDACYQEQALAEMLRTCVWGGYILLTGKNSLYSPDDNKAMVAERNARRKGHPNYFTDVPKMTSQLREKGISIKYEAYYPYREDMETGKRLTKPPERFYAWELVLNKAPITNGQYHFAKFSDAYSYTWKQSGWNDSDA